MDARIDWIWLQQALGPGMERPAACFPIFAAPPPCGRPRRNSGYRLASQPRERDRLAKRDRDSARRLLDAVLSAGDWVLTPEDAYYPSPSAGTAGFSAGAVRAGEPPDLEHWPAVGMVGTRKCSDEGRRAAGDIARSWPLHGVVVVSGGAEGIDAASHWGSVVCLRADRGSAGLRPDVDYPALNREMRLRILNSRGALLSEYPYGSPPCAIIFPCVTA